MSFSLLEQNLCIVEAIPIKGQLCQSEMQIAEPARNKGRPRQLDGPFQMFGRGSVVLLLPLQIAEATENIDSLASSPTVPRQPQRLQQCVPGELEVTSISKKVSILAQTPGQNVMISALPGVPYCTQ
jgi:hypothetical protein